MDDPRISTDKQLRHAFGYAGSEAPRKGRQGYLGKIKAHIDALTERVAALEKALPKTADGVVVAIHDEVWRRFGGKPESYRVEAAFVGISWFNIPHRDFRDVSACYSTKETASAAP